MRLIYVSLPLSVLLAGAGVYFATRPSPIVEGDLKDLAPRHPVTKIMLDESERKKLKPAPDFSAPDILGKARSRDDLMGDRPAVVFFIKDGCPCSIDAQPLINRLALKFKDKVQFIGILDVDGNKAKKWADENRPTFPVLTDPTFEIVRAYGATNSVYTYFVGPDRRIDKMWPGYWAEMLVEMNALLSKSLGEKPTAFDPQYAPKAPSSGCPFIEPKG